MNSTQLRAIRPAVAVLLAFSVVMAVLLAAVPVGAAQAGVQILGSGGSDDLIPPPSPRCDDLVFVTEVSFDAAGNPIDIPRFGTSPDLTQVFDVPDFEAVGPGVLELNEVIVYDGHIGRAQWTPQLLEQVYFEFLLDGVVQVTTPPTPDVPDGQRTGWHDLHMGFYDLPNGADTLRIRHAGGNSADVESLVVSAVCGQVIPFPEAEEATTTVEATTTTAPTTTVTPTTEAPGTTAPATTEAPATTTTEVIETEVEGQVEEQPAPQLAVTGRTQQAAAGFALLAVGLGILLMALSVAESKLEY